MFAPFLFLFLGLYLMSSLIYERISQLLESNDPEQAVRFHKKYEQFSLEKSIEKMAEFWAHELLSMRGIRTVSARLSLTLHHDANTWMRQFENDVLPIIIRFGLPRGN